MSTRVVVVGILVLLLFSSMALGIVNVAMNKNFQWGNIGQTVEIDGMQYTTHSVIRINSNLDFTSENGVVGGSGTKDDPYIISGWDIDAHGAGNAIYIGNTTAYFVVRNCYLHNASHYSDIYFDGNGITLYNVTNGVVENNNCSNNEVYGIYLYSSTNNVISSNICNNNWDGIYLRSSSRNVISNNTCSDNVWSGIYLYYYSNNNRIFNNTCNNNEWGNIYIKYSGNNKLYGNKMVNNGIILDGFKFTYTTQNISSNNTVNGKPVYYYKNENMNNASVPSNAGQLVIGNVSWLRIENLRISNASAAVEIGYSSHIVIKNNTFNYNKWYGIYLLLSENNVISNNTCNNNSVDGIFLDSTHNDVISNNTCNGNKGGYGIDVLQSSNDVIFNNTCIGNIEGIWLQEVKNDVVTNDICNRNSEEGIYMVDSSHNVVLNNLFTNNRGYGIYIESGSNNLIYNNTFFYNHRSRDTFNSSHIQAYDDGTNNSWNSSTGIGNYWHDWANNNDTNDQNHDGIVDWPYIIAGSSDAKDYYPLKNTTYPKPPSAPTPPLNLRASAGKGYVKLTWDPPTDNGGSPITKYKIYRGMIAGYETYWTSVNASLTSYNDTSVMSEYTYYYYVTAVNSVGESLPSNEVNVTTPSNISLPSAPQNLQASAGNGYVLLTWQAPSNNGGASIRAYRIYRGTSSGGEYFLTGVSGSTTSYNDSSVRNGYTYYYYVTAVNSVGESQPSNEVNVTPKAPPTPPQNLQASVGDGYVTLSWYPPASDGGSSIIEYRIYRGTSSGGESYLAEVSGSTLEYTDTSVKNGHTYYYYVTAVNGIGESKPSNEVSATPQAPPSPPQNLQATAGEGYVNLSWNPPLDNGGSDIIEYRIYRGTSSGSETYLATVNASTTYYKDTNVSNGTTYYYYVTAVNSAGESKPSNEVSVTPSAPQGNAFTNSSGNGENLISQYWWTFAILAIAIISLIVAIILKKKPPSR